MIELIGGPLDGLLLRLSGKCIPVTWLPDGKGVLGWNTGGDWTAIYHGPAQKLQHIGWMSEQGRLSLVCLSPQLTTTTSRKLAHTANLCQG